MAARLSAPQVRHAGAVSHQADCSCPSAPVDLTDVRVQQMLQRERSDARIASRAKSYRRERSPLIPRRCTGSATLGLRSPVGSGEPVAYKRGEVPVDRGERIS
jgi:hypothetical protein